MTEQTATPNAPPPVRETAPRPKGDEGPGAEATRSLDFSDAKVLIVDDTPANLDLLRDMLKPLGAQIYFATSGATALDIACNALPDLVLLDVMMPGMDGLETCRRLKSNAALEAIPVIFVTAKTELDDLVRGFDAGGVDYITKPVRQPEVHARVSAHLQIQGLVRQQRENLAALDLARRELQELNATKDKFLSSIGRSLRDSLREISSASQALRESALGDRPAQEGFGRRLGDMNRSAETVLGLLENILEWPRVQTGQKLDLLDMAINDRDLGYLVDALGDLRFLSLAGTRITDAGLEHVRALTGLRELHLDGTAITDGGLSQLCELGDLEVLDLKDTAITDAGLARLKPLRNLKGLYLTRTAVTDEGIGHLADLPNLRTLILWDTRISDRGLRHLQPLRSLQELILWGSSVSAQGVEELRKSLPECDVSVDMFA
jgi:CheY-like chemotaxis protein